MKFHLFNSTKKYFTILFYYTSPNTPEYVHLFYSSGEHFVPPKWNKDPLGSDTKSMSLTFTKEIMVCLTITIIQVINTEIAILLLFRARISVNLPLIGPTETVKINEKDRGGGLV